MYIKKPNYPLSAKFNSYDSNSSDFVDESDYYSKEQPKYASNGFKQSYPALSNGNGSNNINYTSKNKRESVDVSRSREFKKTHHYRNLSIDSNEYPQYGIQNYENSVPSKSQSDLKVIEQKNRNLTRIKSRERRNSDYNLSRSKSRDRDRDRDRRELDSSDRTRRDRSSMTRVKSRDNTEYYDKSLSRVKSRDRRDSSRSDDRTRSKNNDRRDSSSTHQSEKGLSRTKSRDRRERADYNRDRNDGVGRTIIKIRSRDRHYEESPQAFDGRGIRRNSYDSASDRGATFNKSRRSSKSTIKEPPSRGFKNTNSIAYPEGVKYRPGRIQTLTGAQEVALKQTWATICKSWGYQLNMSVEDTKHEECFVASTRSAKLDNYVNSLERINTRASMLSTTSTKSKASAKRFWTRQSNEHAANDDWMATSQRMIDINTKSSSERYEPCIYPSKDMINAFVNHYQLTYEFADDYISSDEEYSDFDDGDDDNASIDSFVTANSEFLDRSKAEIPRKRVNGSRKPKRPRKSKRTPGEAVYSTLYHSGPVPKTPLDVQESAYPMVTDASPKEVQQAIMKGLRNDLADNFVLRFLRARKWHVYNGMQMLYNSASWRQKFPADKWVMEADGPSYLNQTNKGLIKNFTVEKAWINGWDNENNIIFWFQASKHFGTDSSAHETQRYALLCVEWVRLFLKDYHESADTCTVVFDLSGFTLKNADYTNIKFLAEIFEAQYPESLGKVFVHNAPWVFSTVWNIIKHWLDPIVASKIVFTKSHDLPNYINPCYIPVYLGGTDTVGPSYPPPKAGDDHPPKRKDKNYRRLRKTRDDLMMRLLDCTRKWVETTNPDVSALYLEERIALNVELVNNYIDLDPYIRNPGVYDRNGLLKLAK